MYLFARPRVITMTKWFIEDYEGVTAANLPRQIFKDNSRRLTHLTVFLRMRLTFPPGIKTRVSALFDHNRHSNNIYFILRIFPRISWGMFPAIKLNALTSFIMSQSFLFLRLCTFTLVSGTGSTSFSALNAKLESWCSNWNCGKDMIPIISRI